MDVSGSWLLLVGIEDNGVTRTGYRPWLRGSPSAASTPHCKSTMR
jgi:hypothetical protein